MQVFLMFSFSRFFFSFLWNIGLMLVIVLDILFGASQVGLKWRTTNINAEPHTVVILVKINNVQLPFLS